MTTHKELFDLYILLGESQSWLSKSTGVSVGTIQRMLVSQEKMDNAPYGLVLNVLKYLRSRLEQRERDRNGHGFGEQKTANALWDLNKIYPMVGKERMLQLTQAEYDSLLDSNQGVCLWCKQAQDIEHSTDKKQHCQNCGKNQVCGVTALMVDNKIKLVEEKNHELED